MNGSYARNQWIQSNGKMAKITVIDGYQLNENGEWVQSVLKRKEKITEKTFLNSKSKMSHFGGLFYRENSRPRLEFQP